jgi:F-box and WD-40 domain protein 1/11
MLLQASKVSRSWRERTLESRLWKKLFVTEGWGLNTNEIELYESTNIRDGGLKKSRSRKAESYTGHRRQKRRARKEGTTTTDDYSSGPSRGSGGESIPNWAGRGQSSLVGPAQKSEKTIKSEHDPEGSPSSLLESDEQMPDADDTVEDNDLLSSFSPTLTSSSLICYQSGRPRLNHYQIYKQRRKLEDNWAAGRFKPFQLPHRNHPEEAHTECVYTIQYSGNYLVSGSRDRSLRIWNLETQRLIGKPLLGHNASVLCLQFDPSEKEDVIISGSSDTNVIIWQFSTGRIIKKLVKAHAESVLNLKFDERFLVTCSKDKTIKVWSRQELRPGDRDYPVQGLSGGAKFPTYIVDLTAYITPHDIDENLTLEQKQPLPPYTGLMSIDSHGAAVNAVHIQKDQLVSASGDRTLMIWNIHSGVRTGVCIGHSKGIACVQYDGTRIVSGSSDNTIRIFDAATTVEVACLTGHSKLVRTIQIAFGDQPGTEEDLQRQAQEIDLEYFKSQAQPTSTQTGRRARDARQAQGRNPGSSRPEAITAVGAKIPPGGGGSPWGRIVSGSYDETIIIWKKAPDGSWVVGHRLNQAEALIAAGGPLVARSELLQHAQHHNGLLQHHINAHGPLTLSQATQAQAQLQRAQAHAHAQSQQPTAQQTQVQAQAQAQAQTQAQAPFPAPGPGPLQTAQSSAEAMDQTQTQLSAQQVVQHAMATGAAALQAGLQNVAALHNQLINNNQNPSLANPAIAGADLQRGAAALQAGLHNVASLHQQIAAHPTNQAGFPQPTLYPNPLAQMHYQHQPAYIQHPQPAIPAVQPQHHNQVPPVPMPYQAQQLVPPPPRPTHPQAAHMATGMQTHPNARVFKLQFDARRLICCSQDPKIVGWDFANGDEEIIECSRFFAPPT